jgi:hypothetical protein
LPKRAVDEYDGRGLKARYHSKYDRLDDDVTATVVAPQWIIYYACIELASVAVMLEGHFSVEGYAASIETWQALANEAKRRHASRVLDRFVIEEGDHGSQQARTQRSNKRSG